MLEATHRCLPLTWMCLSLCLTPPPPLSLNVKGTASSVEDNKQSGHLPSPQPTAERSPQHSPHSSPHASLAPGRGGRSLCNRACALGGGRGAGLSALRCSRLTSGLTGLWLRWTVRLSASKWAVTGGRCAWPQRGAWSGRWTRCGSDRKPPDTQQGTVPREHGVHAQEDTGAAEPAVCRCENSCGVRARPEVPPRSLCASEGTAAVTRSPSPG